MAIHKSLRWPDMMKLIVLIYRILLFELLWILLSYLLKMILNDP